MAFDPDRKAYNSTLRPRAKGKPVKRLAQRPGYRWPKSKEGKPKKGLSTKRKVTGELELGKRLYAERGGVSDLSGLPLLPPDHPMFYTQISHILPKGNYPRIRLYPCNIMMVLYEEHRQWEEVRDKNELIRLDPRWRRWVELQSALRLEYNTNPQFPDDAH